MRLDDIVTVQCTDTDTSTEGRVVRMRAEWIDVMVGETVISLRRTKPGLYVGSRSGMEFVVKAA